MGIGNHITYRENGISSIGNHCVIYGNDCQVVGNHNIVYGHRCQVTGNHNIIHTDDCVVTGQYNIRKGSSSRSKSSQSSTMQVPDPGNLAFSGANIGYGCIGSQSSPNIQNTFSGVVVDTIGSLNGMMQSSGGVQNIVGGTIGRHTLKLSSSKRLTLLNISATTMQIVGDETRIQWNGHELVCNGHVFTYDKKPVEINRLFEAYGASNSLEIQWNDFILQIPVKVKLQKKLDPKDDEETDNPGLSCAICMANKKAVSFNCGHVCVCIACSIELKECPLCRVPITKTKRAFI